MPKSDVQPQKPALEYARSDSAYERPGGEMRSRRNARWMLAALIFLIAAFLIAIIIPNFTNNGHGSGNADKCRSNLHQIGMAIELYANEFGGQWPQDLQQLLVNEKLNPAALICPGTDDVPATRPSDLLEGGHCSYVYLGRGLTDKTVQPNDVVAYEPPANHDHCTILFGDGRSEAVPTDRGAKLVAAAEAAMKARSSPAKS